MKVYLAGSNKEQLDLINEKIYILESFAYIKKHKNSINKLINNKFLLDSGAFTFIGNSKKTIDWNKYVEDYADFINSYNIKYFFELDIYSVIGIKETELLRNKLEILTNKKSIPVWHIFLGVEYYKKICNEYNYIAIGASGKHDSKWTRTHPEKLKSLVDYAKSKKVKVHGLGYTVLNQLKIIKFYSVDSTTWLNGSKYGEYQIYNGFTIKKIQGKQINKKSIRSRSLDLINSNFKEWIKFQKYAEINY